MTLLTNIIIIINEPEESYWRLIVKCEEMTIIIVNIEYYEYY